MDIYKRCFVPGCNNDSINSPDKIIVRIREDLRKEWCTLANVEYFNVYTMYCCEDHFNVSSESHTDHSELANILRQDQPTASFEHSMLEPVSTHPFQVEVAIQASVKMTDKATNVKFKTAGKIRDIVPEAEIEEGTSSPSLRSPSLFGCTSETEETTEAATKKEHHKRKLMLEMIYKKPKMYLGLPKPYLWLLDHIVKASSLKINSLYLTATLLKIKQNDSIVRISDELELSRSNLSTMILMGIEALSEFFQNLVFCPEPIDIKKNLPLAFKIRYSNVTMIIDCFEIQISKPSDPLKQSQSWSQYKHCNTVKFLLGCTPKGHISFISKSYGGRISDKAIVLKSNLVDCLPPNAVVLADRGFKEIESLLNSRGMKLLRPPTVYAGVKQSKMESMQSKVIASLRVHVERVIRRVREFLILKPHSTVPYQYVPYLDEIAVIACGLINLQGEIIKNN